MFLTFLTCAAMTMVYHCNADSLPPPTRLSYEWLDPFTVKVSWERPNNLPQNCNIKFEYIREDKDQNKDMKRTDQTHFTDSCLTEDNGSDEWNYTIRTIHKECSNGCNGSETVITTIRTPKPRAELVKDFKCLLDPSGMNCSWIPVNQALNLTLSYRKCGPSEELTKSLKKFDRCYTSGGRHGCYLEVGNNIDIWINAASEENLYTFKPLLVIPSPNLTIQQQGSMLNLNWIPPDVGGSCNWIYTLCTTQCNKDEVCIKIPANRGAHEPHEHSMPYDENCLYEFRTNVSSASNCPKFSSDFTSVTYGTNKPLDETLKVVAIVIPIILSACVILSCYCFRRHSAIICPIIPDPSAIFKEMMMNGNKELKATTGSLYTPVPEPIEPCNITLVKETSVLQQNS